MAINDVEARYTEVKNVHRYSEVLKIQIQLAKTITNISFKVFEQLAVLAVSISKQCKGANNK